MSRWPWSLFAFLIVQRLCSSCEPTPTPYSPGDDYFPLESGRYSIYDVQEQQYSLAGSSTTHSYQLKEVTGAAYSDVTGQSAYRLTRYRRSNETQAWQADSVWSARRVNNEAIRTENGVDFVKLTFPVSDQLAWDGNRYNALGQDVYTIRNSSQPYRVFDKQFDETTTVIEQNDSTLVSQDKRTAVYAKGVGLIFKERLQVQFCSSTPACIGKYQIDYGIRQVYRLRAYGKDL